MKKYILSIMAIALAFAFSAFTPQKKDLPKATSSQAWFILQAGQNPSDETKYTMTGNDGEDIPDCPTTQTYRCAVLADVQDENDDHPGAPDLSTVSFELKRSTP